MAKTQGTWSESNTTLRACSCPTKVSRPGTDDWGSPGPETGHGGAWQGPDLVGAECRHTPWGLLGRQILGSQELGTWFCKGRGERGGAGPGRRPSHSGGADPL